MTASASSPGATYWEHVAARTRWGSYISEVEKRAVLAGHHLCESPARALEVGCEGGRWSRLLAEAGWSMICTEVDGEALALCRQRLPDAQCVLVRPDDTTLPCPTNSIRLLVCIEVPPVIESDWFLPECARVLEDGGVVVGTFFNLISIRGFTLHLKAAVAGGTDYYRSAYAHWRKKLRAHHFCLHKEEGYCWLPFRRNSDSWLVPWGVRLEQNLRLGKLPFLSPWLTFVAQKAP